MQLNEFKSYIKAASSEIKADTVIKNANLVNVSTREIYMTEIAIYKEKIVAVDKDVTEYTNSDTKIIDAKGQYVIPGFIDGHIHVECSKLSMTSFSNAVIAHGTTSIISGLDEYISVIGVEGLKEIFTELNDLPLKVFWGSPYKTPYTMPQSTIAYNINSDVQKELLQQEDCYGVWELVREAVQSLDDDTLKTLLVAKKYHKPIFGCSPMVRGKNLNEYLMSGVRLDHESYDHEEMLEKVRKGMHVLIRESSVTHFLEENIKLITQKCPDAARFVSFCSDDVTAKDLIKKGHIDNIVKLAISAGVDPITAIQMATINSAEAYQISDKVGLIAPGCDADILFTNDLNNLDINKVIAKGKIISSENKLLNQSPAPKRSQNIKNKLNTKLTSPEDFEYKVDIENGIAKIKTIESIGPFVRKQKEMEAQVSNNIVQPSVDQDIAIASVIERYGKNGNKSLAFANGWGLKKGALASSAAADDNNIVALGTNSSDMSIAVNTLIENGGGQVIVVDGKIINLLKLSVAGIVSDESAQTIADSETKFLDLEKKLGSTLPDPMFYMSFLPITAIPDIALTDVGLTDCINLKILNPITELISK